MTTTTTTRTEGREERHLLDIALEPIGLTQKDVVSLTLSGPALVITILGMIIGINLFHPSYMCTFIATAPIAWFIYNDYSNFLSLGPGGTPSTFAGYIRITWLRLFALTDPYTASQHTNGINPASGYYEQSNLPNPPYRTGTRPKVAGIAPQRQVSQYGSRAMYLLLRTSLENFAINRSREFKTDTSCFEKKGLALFSLYPKNKTCNGEICHVHHTDHSMHLNLHPHDARIVLERGWGERHPLAEGARFWVWPNFIAKRLVPKVVPEQFVMIYAPRDRAELEVICQIIQAAIYWSTQGHIVMLPIENVPLGPEHAAA